MLTWSESSSCTSPCTITYNVYRGATAGGESTTPAPNATPLTTLTYTDSTVALGNTYYYVVQAVETTGGLVLNSANSNEVSCTLPQAPVAPLLGTPTLH